MDFRQRVSLAVVHRQGVLDGSAFGVQLVELPVKILVSRGAPCISNCQSSVYKNKNVMS